MKKQSYLQPMIVAVDFDGTIIVKNDDLQSPMQLLPNAREVINWMKDHGFYIIIWTCRDKEKLVDAINFLEQNEIKYDKVNENADWITFTESRKIFFEVCIDDRNFGTFKNVDWLVIKEEMKKIYIGHLAEDILNATNKIKDIKNAKNEDPEAPYLRGKPNEDNPEQGIGEAVQNMYEGVDGEEGQDKGKYDQLKIVTPKRDWINDERLIDEVASVRDTPDIDYMNDPEYHENPKGTGEKISPAVMGPDEEAVKNIIDEKLIYRKKIKPSKQKYRRDNTQKYPTTDQPLFRDNYWKERHPK